MYSKMHDVVRIVVSMQLIEITIVYPCLRIQLPRLLRSVCYLFKTTEIVNVSCIDSFTRLGFPMKTARSFVFGELLIEAPTNAQTSLPRTCDTWVSVNNSHMLKKK